jgi:uncharacterized repeat protein (TIGR03803 family)
MRIPISARYGLAVCAALWVLAGCGGGSSPVAPSVPFNSPGGAPLASHYQILHTFQGGADGVTPFAGLLFENGQLYGTTTLGGSGPSGGDGTVFKMSMSGTKTTLYNFQYGTDGAVPEAGLTAGSDGAFYGDTTLGGGATECSEGCGTVYELVPSSSGYTEKVIYAFQGGEDGAVPVGNLLFDPSGALYGTTVLGGGSEACENASKITGCGTVFKLTPSGSGYTESILYSFQAGNDGMGPRGTLIEDTSGALYGTTEYGGGASACSSPSGNAGCGTVFKLTPSGSTYTESVLYRFQGGSDGLFPRSALLARSKGTLVGATERGGASNAGTIYELSPSGSGYSENILFAFNGPDGAVPADVNGLYADSHGNLYGTTVGGGKHYSAGAVFKLTPSGSGYTETVLYKFKATRKHDGFFPQASLTADSSGTLYGTTSEGGLRKNGGYGIVFKISP